jgi:hypothetical protein
MAIGNNELGWKACGASVEGGEVDSRFGIESLGTNEVAGLKVPVALLFEHC